MIETELGGAALLGVSTVAAATTFVMMLLIRRCSDQEAIGRAKAQAQARLLECRLFRDDPVQVLRSQCALFLSNLRILRLLLPSLALSTLPILGVLWTLDSLYSRAPLEIGKPAVVSARGQQQSIGVPAGFVVETKPLYTKASGQTSWRIRPTQRSSGRLQAGPISEKLVSGPGSAFLPRSFFGDGSLEIRYPKATILSFPWMFWFVVVSLLSVLVLRRPLRVRL